MPTQERTHTVSLALRWEGGSSGAGRLDAPGLGAADRVSAPAALGGPGLGTSPEALLLASAAGCYAVTLAGILERMRLRVTGLEIRSEAVVEAGPPVRLAGIVHRPRFRLEADADVARARRAALLAEEYCMVSAALRGNVGVRVEPEIGRG